MILVTGGTGFLGRNLLPVLVADGYHVRVVTRTPDRHLWLRQLDVEVIEADVTDAEAIDEAMRGCRYVVHGAGKFRFWGQRQQFERTNLHGSRNVMEAALATGVEKLIHISTVVVVGTPSLPGEIDETHPTNPADAYQESKLAAERLALQYYAGRGLPVVVLRPGAFYGPYGHYAFNKMFFEDPMRGLPIGVNGGRLYTFPTYIKDVARAIGQALEHGQPGEIYNICGRCLTHREVDQIIAAAAGISSFHIYVPGYIIIPFARLLTLLGRLTNREPKYPITLRSYIFNNWCVSSAKAQRELGFQATPFEQGVRETVDWYRALWKERE